GGVAVTVAEASSTGRHGASAVHAGGGGVGERTTGHATAPAAGEARCRVHLAAVGSRAVTVGVAGRGRDAAGPARAGRGGAGPGSADPAARPAVLDVGRSVDLAAVVAGLVAIEELPAAVLHLAAAHRAHQRRASDGRARSGAGATVLGV